MLDRAGILRLIPHQGAMCLLDLVESWSQDTIRCRAASHLAPANPLRRLGRLNAVAAIEYGLQAAALHGALRRGAPQPPGWLAALRDVNVHSPYLDDAAIGTLLVEATLVYGDAIGLIYDFRLLAEDGRKLLDGRATIAMISETR